MSTPKPIRAGRGVYVPVNARQQVTPHDVPSAHSDPKGKRNGDAGTRSDNYCGGRRRGKVTVPVKTGAIDSLSCTRKSNDGTAAGSTKTSNRSECGERRGSSSVAKDTPSPSERTGPSNAASATSQTGAAAIESGPAEKKGKQRTPRKAWSQYVPPSRRGLNDKAGTAAANPVRAVGASRATSTSSEAMATHDRAIPVEGTHRAPATSVPDDNNVAATSTSEDTEPAAVAAAASSPPPPPLPSPPETSREHQHPAEMPARGPRGSSIVYAQDVQERQQGVLQDSMKSPGRTKQSDVRNAGEGVQIELEVSSATSASVERPHDTCTADGGVRGETTADDVGTVTADVSANDSTQAPGSKSCDRREKVDDEEKPGQQAASAVVPPNQAVATRDARSTAEGKRSCSNNAACTSKEDDTVEEKTGARTPTTGPKDKEEVTSDGVVPEKITSPKKITDSTPYIPPGRRRTMGESPQGEQRKEPPMGPLWPSGSVRTPVRVSQKARPSDSANGSSPTRSTPSRVAGVVGGGMSAYGAKIEEYSGEQAVPSCTLLWFMPWFGSMFFTPP